MKIHEILVEFQLQKNQWAVDISNDAKQEVSDDLIHLVQTAYAGTPRGSFVNNVSNILPSDWAILDFDDEPDVDSAVFYRGPRPGESWKGFKIQGLGHDGTKASKDHSLSRMVAMLNRPGWWIESSGTLRSVLANRGCNIVQDPATLQSLFPDTGLEMINQNTYTRQLPDGASIIETVFGHPKVSLSEDIIAADSNPDLRTMLAEVREEMEAVDDASMDSREGDANYAGLSRDYSALLAIENVIKNNLKAIKNNVMDNNIFMYDYDGDIDEIAAIHVEMSGPVAHVKWLGSYNGRGGELYRAAMQEARRRGATSVEVEAKWNSDGFYRKMGLDTTQPGEYNPFTDSQLNKMAGPLEEETLAELTGIKGIVSKLPKPRDSRFDPLGVDWHTVLNNYGFRSLGYGSFGVVWENPKLPYVLKVFSSKDSAYIDWISVARQNKNNPHMPRFVSARLLTITPEVLAIRMEKLFPVINQEKNVVFESAMLLQERYNPSEQIKSVGFDTDQRNLRYYCQTNPTWLPALDIVKNFSNNSGYRLDFHNKNVMMRDADTLVITDPVYNREDLAGR
jgi:hypothetical protein